jgi:glycosyltransferase involved in cell wall biosynthesis
MKNKPLISVIMPVFNAEKTIIEALESIRMQTLKDFELIIIDDASSDASFVKIKYFKDRRIRLIHLKNHVGVATALNIGLENTHGKYIARMDSDDVCHSERFAKQVSFLELHSDVVAVGSWVILINADGEVLRLKKMPVASQEIRDLILRFNPLIHPTLMIRSEVFKQIGVYDTQLNGAEDYDLMLRLVSRLNFVNLPEVLLKFRVTRSSITSRKMKHTEAQALRARFKALREYEYPTWQIVYAIKPLMSFIIPVQLKHLFLRYD